MEDKEVNRLTRLKLKYKRTGNLGQLAETAHALGVVYADRGDHDRAVEEHTDEYCAFEDVNDVKGMTMAARLLGECHLELEDFPAALEKVQTYLQLASSSDSKVELQRAYVTLGRVYLAECGTLLSKTRLNISSKECDKAFSKAAELCAQLKSELNRDEYHEMKASLLINIGLLAEVQGKDATAQSNLKNALTQARDHGLHNTGCIALRNLAQFHIKRKEFSEAKLCLEELVERSDKVQEGKRHSMEAHRLLVLVSIELGETISPVLDRLKKLIRSLCRDDREDLYKLAVNLHKLILAKQKLKTSDDKGKIKLYEKMGDYCVNVGASYQALAAYQKCFEMMNKLKYSRESIIPLLVSLAVTYQDVRQYTKAVTYYAQESRLQQELGNHLQAAKSTLHMAQMAEQCGADIDILKKSYGRAIDVSQKAGTNMLYQTLEAYADALKSYGCDAERREIKTRMSVLGKPEDFESQETDKDDAVESGDEGFQLSDSDDDMVQEETMLRSRPFKVLRNEVGETRLHTAVIKNKWPQVTTLLAENRPSHEQSFKEESNVLGVSNHMHQGHPVDIGDHTGWLPLHEAANHNRVEIAKLLIKHGAEVNHRGGSMCEGITALHDACSVGHVEVAEVLLDNGADVLIKCDKFLTALDYLLTFKENYYNDCDQNVKVNIDHLEDRLRSIMIKRGITPKPKKLPLTEVDELPIPSPALRTAEVDLERSRSSSPVYGGGIVSPVKDGKTMYRDAVAGVRKSAKRVNMKESTVTQNVPQASALIPEEETKYVMDPSEWMVNDCRSPAKKKLRGQRNTKSSAAPSTLAVVSRPTSPPSKSKRSLSVSPERSPDKFTVEETPAKNNNSGRSTPANLCSQESDALTPAFERKTVTNRQEQELLEDLRAMDGHTDSLSSGTEASNDMQTVNSSKVPIESQSSEFSASDDTKVLDDLVKQKRIGRNSMLDEDERNTSKELISKLDKIKNIVESQVEMTESCILNQFSEPSQPKLIEKSSVNASLNPYIQENNSDDDDQPLNMRNVELNSNSKTRKQTKKRSLSKEFSKTKKTNSSDTADIKQTAKPVKSASKNNSKENIPPKKSAAQRHRILSDDMDSDEDMPKLIDETPAFSDPTADTVIDLDDLCTQEITEQHHPLQAQRISPTPSLSDSNFNGFSQQSETILAASASQAPAQHVEERRHGKEVETGKCNVPQTPGPIIGQSLTASTPLQPSVVPPTKPIPNMQSRADQNKLTIIPKLNIGETKLTQEPTVQPSTQGDTAGSQCQEGSTQRSQAQLISRVTHVQPVRQEINTSVNERNMASTSELHSSTSSGSHAPSASTSLRKRIFRAEVQCGARTLRIPVVTCDSLTIQWLCDEVQRRIRVSPWSVSSDQADLERQLRSSNVQLTAANGAELFNEDIISHVIADSEMVIASPLPW